MWRDHSWTYDAAGNLTNDGTTSYAFDGLGRLTGTTAPGQIRNYAYNGDGVLASALANGATTTRYTQDLAGRLSQVLATTSGSTTSTYLYSNDADRLAVLTGGVRTWYGTDNQGSVRQTLSDLDAVLSTQNYDPYGTPEGGATPATFGYTGELQEATTGAVYLRARWYQPGTGTLLGVDPMLDSTGQAYAYAGVDPVNGSDPSGNCAISGSSTYELLGSQEGNPCGGRTADLSGSGANIGWSATSIGSLSLAREVNRVVVTIPLESRCAATSVMGSPDARAYLMTTMTAQGDSGHAVTANGPITHIDYKQPHNGCAVGSKSQLTKEDRGGNTNAQGIAPKPGYVRGHLLAASLGGSNSDIRNFVYLTEKANNPGMTKFETRVRWLLDNYWGVQLTVWPEYGSLTPNPNSPPKPSKRGGMQCCTPSSIFILAEKTLQPNPDVRDHTFGSLAPPESQGMCLDFYVSVHNNDRGTYSSYTLDQEATDVASIEASGHTPACVAPNQLPWIGGY